MPSFGRRTSILEKESGGWFKATAEAKNVSHGAGEGVLYRLIMLIYL